MRLLSTMLGSLVVSTSCGVIRRTSSVEAAFLGSSRTVTMRHANQFSLLATSTKKTQYTIDDDVCPPTRPHQLRGTVTKACASLDLFLSKKPIARHTQQAFDALVDEIGDTPPPIVLDSGCGTGRSTKLLGQMYPNHVVIGVDRSFARLTKTNLASPEVDDTPRNEAVDENQGIDSKRPFCEKISDNSYLVRAELVDFWRCCQGQSGWNIQHHFMLYPNPYPTHTRLTQRWYAHSSFPLILKLGSQSITIRSNWKGYLEEFCQAVAIAHSYYEENGLENPAKPYIATAQIGPKQREALSMPLTNFERKYDNVGERTYELLLESSP